MQSASYSSAKRNLSSLFVVSLILIASLPAWAQVKPGDFITPANADKVKDLVSPGEYWRGANGVSMKSVPTRVNDRPPPYKEATQKEYGRRRPATNWPSLPGY